MEGTEEILPGLAVGVMMFGMTGLANSQVLTFDDVTLASYSVIPVGYGGLNWEKNSVLIRLANQRKRG